MNFIYIINKNIKIYRKNNLLNIDDGKNKESIPFSFFDGIVAFNKFEITTSTINFITSKNKAIFLLNRFGKINSLILPNLFASNTKNRLLQFNVSSDQKLSLEVVKYLIIKKLSKIIMYINKFSNLKNIISRKKNKIILKIHFAKNIKELLGIEGNITKYMFLAFKEKLNPIFEFKKRTYNPPSDPVNSLLSLAYSLFYNYIYIYILKKGLDPYIGFLHKRRGKHAVFVSDLMEIYRPYLTFWVKSFLNNEFIDISDFENKNGYFILKKDSLKIFLRVFINNVIFDKNIFFEINDFLKVLEKIEKKGSINEIFIYV